LRGEQPICRPERYRQPLIDINVGVSFWQMCVNVRGYSLFILFIMPGALRRPAGPRTADEVRPKREINSQPQ
jgi:hypothetical protein